MTIPLLDVDVLRDDRWQMHYGERFALEGLLRALRPRLSVEIGRAEGGSLRRIAAHSELVHSFDLVEGPAALRDELPNVDFHTGNSFVQVPKTLADFGNEGQHVDFALIDGDHSAEGVRKDAEALLNAPCCRTTVMVFHDAANDGVREGLAAVGFERHPKVAMAFLDFVPGFLVERGPYRGHIWNGLGLVVLGEGHETPIVEPHRFDASAVARAGRQVLMDSAAPHPATSAAPPAPPPDRRRTLGIAIVSLLAGLAAGAAGARARR
jgi:hypothetical protein